MIRKIEIRNYDINKKSNKEWKQKVMDKIEKNLDEIIEIVEEIDTPEIAFLKGLIPPEREPALSLRKFGEAGRVPIIPVDTANMMRTLMIMNKPKRILEIGTAIGYSAMVMAEFPWVEEIITLERDEDMAALAHENFASNEAGKKIKMIIGDAQETILQLDGKFDLIFIDAAKGHYMDFLKSSADVLNVGGLFVCDNVLFRGMLADRAKFKRRKVTIVKRLKKFLDFISNCPELQTSVLNVGDGLSISVKLDEIKFE